MKRLLIDNSSIVLACLYASIKDEYTTVTIDGKDTKIPDPDTAYEVVLGSVQKTLRTFNLTPINCVLVSDGKNSRQLRSEIWPEYKANRKERVPEFYEVYSEVLSRYIETMLKYGAIAVQKEGVEADDIIGALAHKLDSCVIFSRDKDLAQYPGEFYSGVRNQEIFWGVPFDTIYDNYEKSIENILGYTMKPKSAWTFVKDQYVTNDIWTKIATLGNQKLLSDSGDHEAIDKEIERLKASMPNVDPYKHNILIDSTGLAAGMIPYIKEVGKTLIPEH